MLSQWLSRSPLFLTVYGSFVGFMVYFCAYAFRKPYRAALYDGDVKVYMTIAQLVGYVTSTILGIKLVSELPRTGPRRVYFLMGLMTLAQIGLVLVGCLPVPYNTMGMFLTGFPFGLMWGILVTFLEGRRGSDIMMGCMSCSCIVSSGMVKDIGWYILNHWNVGAYWMPAITGALFYPLFALFVFLLYQLPPPCKQDVIEKVARQPMYHKDRMNYLSKYWPGLVAINVANFFLSAYREFRDTFGTELLTEMNTPVANGIFTQSELLISIITLTIITLLGLIHNNFYALSTLFLTLFLGYALLLVTISLDFMLDGFWILMMTGLSSYLSYTPFGAGFYERKIAHLRIRMTSAFPSQLGGMIGCTGTVSILVGYHVYGQQGHFQVLPFFKWFSYGLSGIGMVSILLGAIYFLWYKKRETVDVEPVEEVVVVDEIKK